MSNWVEDNPARSIVIYTVLIAATTWGVSTYILHDSRIDLSRSELSEQKSLTDLYKQKVDILQQENSVLRSENSEYRAWLGHTTNAIPAIVPRITELKKEIDSLKNENSHLRSISPKKARLVQEQSVSAGSAFVDDTSGFVFSVKSITVEKTANVSIKFPDQNAPIEDVTSAGKQWSFKFGGSSYVLTITDISFLGDVVRFRIGSEN